MSTTPQPPSYDQPYQPGVVPGMQPPPAPAYPSAQPPPAPAYPSAQPPPAPGKRGKRRWPWIVGGAIGLVLLLCFGSIVLALSGGNEPQKANPWVGQPVDPENSWTDPNANPTYNQPLGEEPAQEPSTDPAAVESYNVPIPGTIEVTDESGTVKATVSKAAVKRTCPGDAAVKPENGRYLVLTVTVQVISGTGSINPLFFEFVDRNGVTANSFSGLFAGCGKELTSGNDLRTGSKRSGVLVFDVKDYHGELNFSYPLSVVGSWKVF